MSRNDITGDEIKSKINNVAYSNGWELIFGDKMKTLLRFRKAITEGDNVAEKALLAKLLFSDVEIAQLTGMKDYLMEEEKLIISEILKI